MKKYTLDYCRGSNEGRAIYLNRWDDTGGTGHRMIGPKCWGEIITVKSFKLSLADIEEMIDELRSVKEEMIAEKNK